MNASAGTTGYLYAAIGQNEAEVGYIKFGFTSDIFTRYDSSHSAPYRRMLLVMPDKARRNRDRSDHVVCGDLEQHVLDFFRRGRGSLYDGRLFPPGYAELVKFDTRQREALKRRLAKPQRRLPVDAQRFLRTLLALWEDQMPIDPWEPGAVLPDVAMVPPPRLAFIPRAATGTHRAPEAGGR